MVEVTRRIMTMVMTLIDERPLPDPSVEAERDEDSLITVRRFHLTPHLRADCR